MVKSHVLVIPFPAQGHVIPIMELAQRLVEQNVKVTFVNTEVIHNIVTSNWINKDGYKDLIQMVSLPDGLDPSEDRSDLPKLVKSMSQSMPDKLEEFIKSVDKEDDSKVTCIVVDFTMPWAIQVAKNMGIASTTFCPASVATLAGILSVHKLLDDGIVNDKGMLLKDEMIRLSENMHPIKTSNIWWVCFDDSALIEATFQLVLEAKEVSNWPEWFLCNSTTELEAAALSAYPQLSPIGPLLASNRLADQVGHFWQEDPSCLEWLDQQETSSVIYIAFGSFTLFNQTQFEELAIGLELSNKPFLWVVRPGMTKETTTTFPNGYMERIGSRGRIVSWAPQQKVLAHPSVACFMSHCGWNSTLEGVTNGLPFLCWPYFGDQFQDKSYICDIWKTGLGFDKNEGGIITRGEIKSKIEELFNNEIFKTKALDIKKKVESSITKGGSSHSNFCKFIEWIHEKDSHAKAQLNQ
uniref:UDP-glycosyltransferase 83A1-like n=1 Tax=Erigeron canadensis TaxID=72917 RepID=UPI001CB9523E|nr:UDP-glycosyltransferase 83A1-like [Erigeron canadensis]